MIYYNGTLPKLPERGYFKLKDSGAEVKKLQSFLNWLLKTNLKVDGKLGSLTQNAIKQYQKKMKIKQDGLFGKESLEKAKIYILTRTKMSKIGHARSDIDKLPGDSSGKEVTKSNFTYSTSSNSVYNWTYVFRPREISKANKAAYMCEKAINNNNIGYNSNAKKAYGKDKSVDTLAKKVNYDLSKINTKCGLSCGDLICLCNHYAGLSTYYIGSGKQLAEKMKYDTNFITIKYTPKTLLYRGDVLITAHSSGKNNHVVMCL